MPRLDFIYPKETTWAEFNRKLVRHFRLPAGSEFRLMRHGAARNGIRATVRSDARVRRKLLRKSEHPAGDEVRVSKVVERIETMLPPNVKASVVAFGPRGEVIEKQTTLRTWRAEAPKPTQAERDAAAMRREEIADMVKAAARMIDNLEEGVDDPEEKIPQALMQAVLDRFGNTATRAALDELRLR
jgi:hypothetical protein